MISRDVSYSFQRIGGVVSDGNRDPKIVLTEPPRSIFQDEGDTAIFPTHSSILFSFLSVSTSKSRSHFQKFGVSEPEYRHGQNDFFNISLSYFFVP